MGVSEGLGSKCCGGDKIDRFEGVSRDDTAVCPSGRGDGFAGVIAGADGIGTFTGAVEVTLISPESVAVAIAIGDEVGAGGVIATTGLGLDGALLSFTVAGEGASFGPGVGGKAL